MKNFLIALTVIAVAIVGYCVSTYNKAISLDEEIKANWSQVLNQYERRYDLIPNLVNTVKGYANHEADVLNDVTEKRTQVGKIQLSVNDLSDSEKMEAFKKAQEELSGSLSRLMAVSENYPDLKASQNFLTLQSELEGTENRITVARRDYIMKIKDFNYLLRSIPSKYILNGSFKAFAETFELKDTYTVNPEKQQVPTVSFE